MRLLLGTVLYVAALTQPAAFGADQVHDGHHHDHAMRLDAGGMVMNENRGQLPRGCARLMGEQHLTVRAGRQFAERFRGTMFGYDLPQWSIEPCTKLTITFVNLDDVRHQLMVHGLPRDVYPQGMFTIELAGAGEKTASLIVPPGKKTYLVHCDVPQHMEKGMKAQLKSGGGDGDLPSIPGRSAPRYPDSYRVTLGWGSGGLLLVAAVAGIVVAYKGLTGGRV